MANITLGGNSTSTLGDLPEIGSSMLDARLVNVKLKTVNLSDYLGTQLILNIFPSVGTGVCSASARRFNELAVNLDNTKILNISMDLPFAQNVFCETEGLENIEMLSDFRFKEFGERYKTLMLSGNFEGLHSRAVIVVGTNGQIQYVEQVSEIGQEPDYDSAMATLS